jgi:DNA polymerase-3 subunit delta
VAEPPELEPVYLLTGSDRPKITRALERLRRRFAEGAVESLSAPQASGDDAVAACNALGIFGGAGRLVVVDGVDSWKAADVKAVGAYLDDPAPTSVLALVADQLRSDAPLAKLCAKAGELLVYDVARRDLPRWIGEQFSRLGANADPAACRALVAVVGDEPAALATEIEKLASWAAGEPIDEQAVELLAVPHAQAPPFAVTDAWGARDLTALLAACERTLERTGDPLSRVVSRLVGILASHVARVRECQVLAAEGVPVRDAAGRLGVHRFVAEKSFAHAGNYAREELENALVRLAGLDLALKGASRLPVELELERTLVAITERPASGAAAA